MAASGVSSEHGAQVGAHVSFRAGVLLAFAVAAAAVPSCRFSKSVASEDPPVEIKVKMTDNNFHIPNSLPAGAITFRAVNEGSQPHDLTLIELPTSLRGALDKQLRGDKRMAVLPIAVIKPRQPAESGFFAVDLKPGRYGIVCFVQDANGVAHAAKGMSKELIVR